jgi:serine/threonine-protein kinase
VKENPPAPDLTRRLGALLRRADDRHLARSAARAGFLTGLEVKTLMEDGDGSPKAVEDLLRRKGVSPEQIRKLREEIDREEFALFRPDRQPPPEVAEVMGDPGRRLAEFILVKRLGQGGLGEVWKGWDTRLGRWVAIKLPATSPDHEEVSKRFTREALAAAKLSHPNIVSIHRVAEEHGRTFIVMQHVEGRTLRGLELSLREALEVVRTVAQAVQYAHEQGVIHRDLKPGNIMISSDGRPFVLDFGLAHLEESGRNPSQDGLVAGTAAYMSPEQARGEAGAREPATDIYSLGATLYEMATGRAPFEGAGFAQTLEQVLYREPPSPRSLAPSIPRGVETVILKAMDKDPRRRYATARALSEDLDLCLRGEPVLARRRPVARALRQAFRRHPGLSTFVAALGLAIVGLLLWGGVESRRERERKIEDFRVRYQDRLQAILELRRAGANERMEKFAIDMNASPPEAAETDALRGRIERALLNDDRARELQDRALEKDKDQELALYERMVLAFRTGAGHARDPARELGQKLAQRPQSLDPARAFVVRGILSALKGDRLEARALFIKSLASDPMLEEAWEALAETWLSGVTPHSAPELQESAYREAEQVLGSALSRDRGYVPFYRARADVRAARFGLRSATGQEALLDYQAAEDDYAEALRLAPSAGLLSRRALLHVRRSVHDMDLGENPLRLLTEAQGDLDQALRLRPSSPHLEACVGLVHQSRAEYEGLRGSSPLPETEEVERAAARAIAQDGSETLAWTQRGRAQGLRAEYRSARGEEASGDFGAAEASFAQALRQDPENPEILERRGHLRLVRARARAKAGQDPAEDLRLGEGDLQRALPPGSFFNEARVTRAALRHEMGRALEKRGEDPSGRFEEARRELREVLASNPVLASAWAEQGSLERDWGNSRRKAGDPGAAREHLVETVRGYEEATRLNPLLEASLREPLREARRSLLGPN